MTRAKLLLSALFAAAIGAYPDAKIVEVSIEAHEATKAYLPGTRTKVLAYNGTVPGPIIEANVGDTLVVHFKNSLPMETTIHWHGVRVPNAMDGAPMVQAPLRPGQSFERGSVHVIDLVNDAQMEHPFHLHGFFFQVISQNGIPVPPEKLANKDVLTLPQRSVTRIVARFDRPGMWMFHCHILEHAARGMMAEIDVVS